MMMYTATMESRNRMIITIKPDVLLVRIMSIRLLDSVVAADEPSFAANWRKKKEERNAWIVIDVRCC